MKQLKKNILNIGKNYENLILLSKDSFATIKTQDFEKHKTVKELERREFEKLNQNKEELKTFLANKSAEYELENLRIRDVIALDNYSIQQEQEIEQAIKEMLDKERDFQAQLKMTIEIAKVMYQINGEQLERAFEIAKREQIDKTGSMLLEEDY